jgi:hypothetical protein
VGAAGSHIMDNVVVKNRSFHIGIICRTTMGYRFDGIVEVCFRQAGTPGRVLLLRFFFVQLRYSLMNGFQ